MMPARRIGIGDIHYPESLQAAPITGIVTIEGRVGTDGFVTGLRLIKPVHPDLDNAALEAVTSWRFTPARLNGVLVEVPLRVSIEFRRALN